MQLDDLYQEIIVDHYRNPRGAARLDHISEIRVHENPSCGDSVKVEVKIAPGGILDAVHFDGKGCAISTASASLMSEWISGKSLATAKAEAERFILIMRGSESPDILDEWGDLACLKGVIKFPMRVKCATLAWHALLDELSRE